MAKMRLKNILFKRMTVFLLAFLYLVSTTPARQLHIWVTQHSHDENHHHSDAPQYFEDENLCDYQATDSMPLALPSYFISFTAPEFLLFITESYKQPFVGGAIELSHSLRGPPHE